MKRVKKETFNSDEVYKPKIKYHNNPTFYSSLFPIKSTSPLKHELKIIEKNFEENIQDDIYLDEILIKNDICDNISRSETPVKVFNNVSPNQINTIDCFKQEIDMIMNKHYITYEFENYKYILFEKRSNNSILIHKFNTLNELTKIIIYDDSIISILNVNTNKLKYFNNSDELYDFGLLTI